MRGGQNLRVRRFEDHGVELQGPEGVRGGVPLSRAGTRLILQE